MNLLKLTLAAGFVPATLTTSSLAAFAYQERTDETVYAPVATGGGSHGYNVSNLIPDR
jgi:hypothetical protein